MRISLATAIAFGLTATMTVAVAAQDPDEDRKVAGGGITAAGWQGKVDPKAASQGRSVADSKFAQEGANLHLAIGPAAVYWNPTHRATGDYTVKATFREAKVSPEHPHPYGIFIGGDKLGTDQHTLLYCVAYGDGSYLIRGFNGPEVTTLSKRQPHAAVHKSGPDGSVTQEIAWRVKGGTAECVINGTSVSSFSRTQLTSDAKLPSTDGVVGLRVSHNLDVVVSGFAVSK
jgi:hypothetical protein